MIILAPSWSWAASCSNVKFPHVSDTVNTEEEIFLATVHEVSTELAHSDRMGPVTRGLVKIAGYLRLNQQMEPMQVSPPTVPRSRPAETYDHGYDKDGMRKRAGTFFFAMTYKPPTRAIGRFVRGLILEPTGQASNEFRRIGMFEMDPEGRSEFKDLDVYNPEQQMVTII